jgi:hypothetical protein
MNCKNCKFSHFSDDFSASSFWFMEVNNPLFGSCNRLIAATESVKSGGDRKLSAADKQPLAFAFDSTEVGYYSNQINIHPDFGCVLFEPKL